jgi:rubredoxin
MAAQEPFKVWQCATCGYIYDEAEGAPLEGLAPGTRWADIPDDWICPLCGTAKSEFAMIEL